MNAAVERVFEAKLAVREAVGLLISLVGPSGGGKTFSALRLASGIQRVVGGDIDVIDTENGRALYYAERFKFNHVRFSQPFGPLDYLAAIRYCAKRGSKTVLVDSMSHEHDGVGGVLDIHDQEVLRLAGDDYAKQERVKLLAWSKPKQMRKRLINEILQLNINVICTFRAKEKIKIVKGVKEPEQLGWMPICGDEWMYEMVLQMLLKPGSNGVPEWKPTLSGERAMIKLPEQFLGLLSTDRPTQIDEALGEQLARWASGGARPTPEADALVADYAKCTDADTLAKLNKRREALWTKSTPVSAKERMKQAAEDASRRVNSPAGERQQPLPDAKTWGETLNGQEKLSDLEEAWASCTEAFGGMPPLECESAYQLRREALTAEG